MVTREAISSPHSQSFQAISYWCIWFWESRNTVRSQCFQRALGWHHGIFPEDIKLRLRGSCRSQSRSREGLPKTTLDRHRCVWRTREKWRSAECVWLCISICKCVHTYRGCMYMHVHVSMWQGMIWSSGLEPSVRACKSYSPCIIQGRVFLFDYPLFSPQCSWKRAQEMPQGCT